MMDIEQQLEDFVELQSRFRREAPELTGKMDMGKAKGFQGAVLRVNEPRFTIYRFGEYALEKVKYEEVRPWFEDYLKAREAKLDSYEQLAMRRVWRVSGWAYAKDGRAFSTKEKAIRHIEGQGLTRLRWDKDRNAAVGEFINGTFGKDWKHLYITECFEEASNLLPR